MTPDELIVSLDAQEKVLAEHIRLAEAGVIQEDCVECRKKDLETLWAQIACVRELYDGNKILSILKKHFKLEGNAVYFSGWTNEKVNPEETAYLYEDRAWKYDLIRSWIGEKK